MIHGHRYRPNECVLPCVLALLLLQLTSITLISGFSISGLRSATIATSSSSLYAFPKYSNRSSGNSRKNKSQQNYKHTDDDNDSFTIDGNAAPSTFNTRNRRSRSGSSDSNNGYINHRIQTSNRDHDSNNDNNNRNNNDRWRQHKRRRRPTKLNANELFTLESTAPPLVQTDITNKQVVSPTILLQNDLECHPSICGPLQVTYTNDAKTIERWLCDNVRPVNKGDRYSYVGFDVEVRIMVILAILSLFVVRSSPYLPFSCDYTYTVHHGRMFRELSGIINGSLQHNHVFPTNKSVTFCNIPTFLPHPSKLN